MILYSIFTPITAFRSIGLSYVSEVSFTQVSDICHKTEAAVPNGYNSDIFE